LLAVPVRLAASSAADALPWLMLPPSASNWVSRRLDSAREGKEHCVCSSNGPAAPALIASLLFVLLGGLVMDLKAAG
jgi:hypothetical protein